MKKKILIVGGTGFLGFHLAKFCKTKKLDVTSISTNPPSFNRYIKNIKYIYVDISNISKLKKKIKTKYDYVVNLGGYVDHSNKTKTYNSHYIGCKNLYEVFKKQNLKSFVQMGSSLEYGKNISPLKENSKCNPIATYGRSKYLSSKFLLKKFREENFPVIILRLFQAYGPYQTVNRLIPIVINSCLKNQKFKCSTGNQLRDFIYVEDVVDAIYLSIITKKAKGEILNVGTSKPNRVKDVILLIKKISNGGYPQFGKIKMRQDEIKIFYPEIKKIKKILNWKPKVKFKIGLKKTIQHYSKYN